MARIKRRKVNDELYVLAVQVFAKQYDFLVSVSFSQKKELLQKVILLCIISQEYSKIEFIIKHAKKTSLILSFTDEMIWKLLSTE